MNDNLTVNELLKNIAPDLPKYRENKVKILTEISSIISEYRINKKWSQKDLARYLNVTQGMISKWESCEYNFTIEQVCKISDKLSLTPGIVFFEDEEDKKDDYSSKPGKISVTDNVKGNNFNDMGIVPLSA